MYNNKIIILVSAILFSVLNLYSQTELSAKFSADETQKQIYKQGFDSEEEIEGWTLQSQNNANTWQLANAKKAGLPNFNTIDRDSKYSLSVFYDDKVAQDEKFISPWFTFEKPTVCKFYTAFDGVYVHPMFGANFTISVQKESDNSLTEIFNASQWAEETGHERHKWLPFEINLNDFTGQKIRFIFQYKGIGGDDVYVDQFCFYENDTSDEAKVYINEGQQVHFNDLSEGNPTVWEWTFDGGIPASSTEQNPVITYNKAGAYDVQLKIRKSNEPSEIIKTAFINVQGVSPKANFEFPAEGYLSPETAVYIPQNTSVTFIDKSTNVPTEWQWDLPGTNIFTSTEQNPVVKYTNAGTYGASLTVANAQGTDRMNVQDAIQVGGSGAVWNIGIEESDNIDEIFLGSFFGYYGGSNWIGMVAFAEEFKKPIVKSTISSVDIYFAQTQTIDPPVEIKVSINKDNNGLPGEEITSSTMMSDQLVFDPEVWVPTVFEFTEPVEINEKFYVVISGIPNRTNEITFDTDEVAVGGIRRDKSDSRPTTTYHLLEEWDNNDNPTGKIEWFKSEDENVSLAMAPRLTYDTPAVDIVSNYEPETPAIYIQDKKLIVEKITEKFDVLVYNINGSLIANYQQISNPVILPEESGKYILQIRHNGNKWAYRIVY